MHVNFIYQLQTKGSNALQADAFYNNILDQYTQYIDKNILPFMKVSGNGKCYRFIEKVMLVSVILPIVEDQYLEFCIDKYTRRDLRTDDNLEDIQVSVNELIERKACDMNTRRRMTSEFNSALKAWCQTKPSMAFININQYISDNDRLIVDKKFISNDPTNIHVLWESTLEFWLKEFQNNGVKEATCDLVNHDLEKTAQSYAIKKLERMRNNPKAAIHLRES